MVGLVVNVATLGNFWQQGLGGKAGALGKSGQRSLGGEAGWRVEGAWLARCFRCATPASIGAGVESCDSIGTISVGLSSTYVATLDHDDRMWCIAVSSLVRQAGQCARPTERAESAVRKEQCRRTRSAPQSGTPGRAVPTEG